MWLWDRIELVMLGLVLLFCAVAAIDPVLAGQIGYFVADVVSGLIGAIGDLLFS